MCTSHYDNHEFYYLCVSIILKYVSVRHLKIEEYTHFTILYALFIIVTMLYEKHDIDNAHPAVKF